MKARVNGVEVEGTPEEITGLIGIKIVDLRSQEYAESYRLADEAMKEVERIANAPCKKCPHRGEGCNPQFCL